MAHRQIIDILNSITRAFWGHAMPMPKEVLRVAKSCWTWCTNKQHVGEGFWRAGDDSFQMRMLNAHRPHVTSDQRELCSAKKCDAHLVISQ